MRTDSNYDVRKLLEENIKLSKSIFRSTEKIRKHMQWMKIMSIIRILIIIIPLVLAIIYVPPLLSKLSETFGSLYGGEQFNILNQFKNLNTGGFNELLK